MSRMYFGWPLILITTGLLWCTSCKKVEVEEPVSQGVPVFSVDAQLDNAEINLSAGDDGCSLVVGSTFWNGVQWFNGTLGNNQNEITLKILDGKLDIPTFIFQSELNGALSYLSLDSQSLVHISRDDFPNAESITEIKWYVDGIFKGINMLDILEPGIYNVCASVTFEDGSSESLCNQMIIGYQKSALAILKHYVDPEGFVHAWIDSDLNEVSSIKWSIDGVEVCYDPMMIRHVSSQIHRITADITFENGARRVRNVLTDGSSDGRFLDDFTLFENLSKCEDKDFNVSLIIKHNGQIYSSETSNNQASTFEITDIKYFGMDGSGNKVYSVYANVNCLVRNDQGSELPFDGTINFGIMGE
jgi:hypothetical protein